MWTDYRLGSCGTGQQQHPRFEYKLFNHCLLQRFALSVCDDRGLVWCYACLLFAVRKQTLVLYHVFASETSVIINLSYIGTFR